jgi:outer membrane receptor protein involved in Fe transport
VRRVAPIRALLVVVVLVIVIGAGAGAARGDGPGAGIDLRDLPPLPAETELAETASSIAVAAAAQASEDVVVGAAKREQSLGTVASAVTVISADRLRRFGYRSVAEALRSVAGLYVVDDRMSERLGIRGLQLLGDFNTRILVLIDGATLNEPWNQFVGISEDLPVSIDDIERIEVVRGPVSSVYGTNAFFGIINIVTRGADRSPRAYGRLAGGDFGTISGNAGFAAGNVNRQLRGSLYFQNRSGETVDYPVIGTVSNDGIQAYNGSLVAHWDGAFAQVRAYRKLRELTGAPFGTIPDDTRNHNIDQMVMAEGGYTRDLGDFTVGARAYINRYQFQDYLVTEGNPDFRDIADSFWLGGEVRGHWRILPRNQLGLTVGAEATVDRVESRSFYIDDQAGGTDIPTNFQVAGLYGELEAAPFPWLGVSGGLRWDVSSLFENRVSPRAAVVLHKGDDLGLKLLYARGFRNPSPIEAFFADGMSQIANPSLRPESIASFEAVAWGRPLAGLNLRLSAFRWDLEDMLQGVPVDQNGMEVLQFQNVFGIRSQGLELEGSYRDTRGWYGFAAVTLASVDVLEPDGSTQPAPNAPGLVFAGGASTPRLWGLLHLSAEVQYIGSRKTRDPMTEAADHWTLNAAVVVPAWNRFDFTVGVRNLLGSREQIPAQADYDRDPMTPVYLLPGEGTELYARLGYSY